MTLGIDTLLYPSELVDGLLARAADPLWDRFDAQLRSSGYCGRPILLTGHVTGCDGRRIWSTDEEPNRVLRKACGNRREAVCPTCAERYRQDAYHLIAAGLRGGKGVPDTVAEHPAVFATLTAPSFGVVHTRRQGKNRKWLRCRPRRDAEVCPHGVRMSCGEVHGDEDPCLGEPICRECFDYDAAFMWNHVVSELWRRTSIYLPRAIARLVGITHKELNTKVRVSYVKVAEYQRRGLVHLHVLIRLDRAMPKYRADELRPPAARFTTELLEAALRTAAAEVTAKVPDELGAGRIRWGDELDIRHLTEGAIRRQLAGYLAKYTIKCTADVGGLVHRIDPERVDTAPVSEHMRTYLRTGFELNTHAGPDSPLARCVHQLGYRGHCLTKSRRYSTTFKALREARERHAHEQLLKRQGVPESQRELVTLAKNQRITTLRYAGTGHSTPADAFLARSGATRAHEQRQAAREAWAMEVGSG